MILLRLLLLPLRMALGSAQLGWRTGRAVGPSRAFFFGAGFATGVLLASPGARRYAAAAVAGGVRRLSAPREELDPAHVAAPVDGPVLPTD